MQGVSRSIAPFSWKFEVSPLLAMRACKSTGAALFVSGKLDVGGSFLTGAYGSPSLWTAVASDVEVSVRRLFALREGVSEG